MILDRKSLVELLPAIYRLRDRDQGEPVTRLLSVIAEQIEVLQENLDQLYDDQFIETCAEWVVPYIGDLVGARGVRDLGAAGFSTRSFVANTIAYRRRKGTAAMLEQLARDLTRWNAAVVEFFLRLAWTQNLNHVRLNAPVWIDLRDAEAIEQLGTPFERAMRSVDVRRISSGRGKHNIPNIGIFLWRIDAFSLTSSPAVSLDPVRWMFSPLGNNTPLFSNPKTETRVDHLAERDNVPMPMTRRALARDVARWYGDPGSILLHLGGLPVPAANVESCDLSDIGLGWDHVPAPDGMAAVDPVLGRLTLPDDPGVVKISIGGGSKKATATGPLRYTWTPPGGTPDSITIGGVPVDPARFKVVDTVDIWNPPQPDPDAVLIDATRRRLIFPADPSQPLVTFHYGLSGPTGGGEYERESSFVSPEPQHIRVPEDQATISDAIAALGTNSGVIEIGNSGRYTETLTLAFPLAAGQHV
ncbi:MAG TPA: hypothetical protein VHU41_04475, partial [Thermoanaerobaculia bacterium]|nr:hypothetical protein [Thermoanaerobaculia bacterium]